MLHGHISAWVLGIILFFVAFALQKAGKQKGAKIVHMILRVFYVLIILSGVGLLFTGNFIGGYVIKLIVGLWVVAAMEMTLIKGKKGQSTKGFFIQLIIALLLVIYLGLALPQGWRLPMEFSPFM